jgi:hypothetical protein
MALTLGERVLSVLLQMQNEIFHHCLRRTRQQVHYQRTHHQPVPPLLIAFRADKELYMQALKIYYKINRFDLNDTCIESFNRLRSSTVALIRNLDAVLNYDPLTS